MAPEGRTSRVVRVVERVAGLQLSFWPPVSIEKVLKTPAGISTLTKIYSINAQNERTVRNLRAIARGHPSPAQVRLPCQTALFSRSFSPARV